MNNLQENIRRILREKLNEKEFFFPRRIKLNDVKKQLSIYTEKHQICLRTKLKSYIIFIIIHNEPTRKHKKNIKGRTK